MKRSEKAKVVSNEMIADDIYKMVFVSEAAAAAEAGQFVHIRCSSEDTFLRRPISICKADSSSGEITVVYQVKGSGTRAMSLIRPGENINVLGPLGNGFSIEQTFRHILLVGGGIGIYPLFNVAETYSRVSSETTVDAVLGFRSKSLVTYEKDFKELCSETTIVTDDGSYGEKGTVIAPVRRALLDNNYDMVYVCGPKPMISAMRDLQQELGFKCEVSLEERMGCGVGACLVCTCKVRSGEDGKDGKNGGSWHHKHVCKDGPVFDMNDLYFERE